MTKIKNAIDFFDMVCYNEYKLNQKIADSLERTMGGILENYLKVEESGNEG